MDSTTLRIGILVVGLAVIAGIYGWAKLQERRTRRRARIEPAVGSLGQQGADDDWDVIPILTERRGAEHGNASVLAGGTGFTAADKSPHPAPIPAAAPTRVKELILTLSIIAPRSRQFGGPALAKALGQAGMVYGAMNIFHAPADLERPDGPALFSLANVLEPGTIEPERLRLLETPGVVLFAQLPGPVKGLEVFEHMIATGRYLARELGGELCDETRRPLSAEKTDEIRERIRADIGDAVRKPDL